MNPVPEKKSSGRGCFLYGCLSVVILVLLAITVSVMAIRYYVRTSIEKYTDAEPRQFETANLTDDESKALQDRLQGFARDLQQTNQPVALSLDSREVNAVIATEPALAELKQHVRVQLEGDGLQCLVSVPLDPLAEIPFLGGLKGRHMNATATVRVTLANGELSTRLVAAQVKGNPLPAQALAEIEKNLPWDKLLAEPKVKELIGKLEWVKIADGQVQLGAGGAAP
jgi:hypothetical protein